MYKTVKLAAAESGLRKSQIKELIKKNIIDWKLENGSYIVDMDSLTQTNGRVKKTETTTKQSHSWIKGNRVDFTYDEFINIMINGYFNKKTKISKDCNFVISDFMNNKIFQNQTVIEHLKEKYKGKSEKEMIRIVRQQSLGFIDRKMPNTDYGFLIENINGETILICCGYFPEIKNKVQFFVGLTYEDFKSYIKNPKGFHVIRKTSKVLLPTVSNNMFYQQHHKKPHNVNGHWRNQPYGSRNNPQYKRIWINDFKKGVS